MTLHNLDIFVRIMAGCCTTAACIKFILGL